VVAAHWLTRTQLAALPARTPMVMQCIDDYLAGARLPLNTVMSAANS